MTEERKNELYDQMIAWICEHTPSDEELFQVLHGEFHMTREELHDHSIESLDSFFPDTPKDRLKQRIEENYREYRERWQQMGPAEFIDICDEVEAVTRMYKELSDFNHEEEAEYLLRFQNPLEVVSDEWLDRNGMDFLVIDDEMRHLLWTLQDQGSAEEVYELAPEYLRTESGPQLSM